MGFWDHMRAAQAELNQAMALIGEPPVAGAPGARARRRGRPPAAGRAPQTQGSGAGAAARGTSAGAKRTLDDLPGILAEKYETAGASPDEIAAEMGWKTGTPMSNLSRLIKAGSIVKVGDRYHATTQAAQRAA
jgi:hypothetical protein